MKFKVKEEYRSINKDLVMNPKNCEIGILEQYIDVKGNYRENIDKKFQINSPTNTFQGWKKRYEELFEQDVQTSMENEKYPVGTSWHTECKLGWYTIEAIIHIYDQKLYVISNGGHKSGLFGVNSEHIEETLERLDLNKNLLWE